MAIAPRSAAISHELAAKLDAALAELPDEQREAIVLHLQGGLPFREIAKLNEISDQHGPEPIPVRPGEIAFNL